MSDDDVLAAFIMGGIALLFLVWALSSRSQHRERERRQQREIELRRAARHKNEEAQAATAFWLNLKHAFPYLHTPEISEPTADRI